ncbi:hypothetical protein MTR67_021720 [Solanum verrucosum]|uniref:KIB1-4 beta-propeller domain-containing protein n=1 Tax=Solanum verrucosum TaxID=315347 RepID=A0AAF0QWE5_SOLVR|nr:uncharacterized protein LOC125821427 [Solanum verrucosum]WMV28335.1 hypothetical protein MTR67_021720 [Solanum verrucosum]
MAAAASTKVPLLMLAEKGENGEIREFFDLSSGITHSMNLPELAGKCCLGVGFPGWVFTSDKQGNMNLFHIFTRTLINLPHMSMLEGYDSEEELGEVDCTDYVEKAVISADPLSSPTTDYVLGLIQGDIVIFSFQHDDCGGARIVKGIPVDLIGCCQLYIVYSMGELLVIHRDGPISDEGQDTDQYGAKAFHVYKINDCNYEEIKDLGDRALFVGKSATLDMAIEDDQGSGCKRNHIYFTDDCVDSYFNLEQGGGKDMGVYNMVDGTIVPHYTGQSYHKVTPPLWV